MKYEVVAESKSISALLGGRAADKSNPQLSPCTTPRIAAAGRYGHRTLTPHIGHIGMEYYCWHHKIQPFVLRGRRVQIVTRKCKQTGKRMRYRFRVSHGDSFKISRNRIQRTTFLITCQLHYLYLVKAGNPGSWRGKSLSASLHRGARPESVLTVVEWILLGYKLKYQWV